ncbi:MAG: hypothetical protein M9934_05355 [Thermomicrobiales bacterium]|nr:hypothetical protein [Thermomicrobiales bacterium]
MHGILRRPALHFAALLLVIIGMLPIGGIAAQGTTSTYTSESFGYTVSWTDDWELNAELSLQQASLIDLITLFSVDGNSFVMITGFDTNLIEVETMLESDPEDEILEQNLEGPVPYTLIRDDRSLQRTEVYTLDNGETGLMVMMWGPEKGFDQLITQVQDTVLINGKMIMTGQNLEAPITDLTGDSATPESTKPVTRTKRGSHTTESTDVTNETTTESGRTSRGTSSSVTPTPGTRTSRIVETEETPEPTEVALGVMESYTGSVFGYTLEFDTDLWTMDGVFETDDLDGIRLYGDTSTLTVWAWGGYGADAQACLQGESEFYSTQVDAIADWQTATNANGEPLWFESEDLSWGVFTLTYEGTALVDYISCQPIPGQDAVLITLLSSLPDGYNEALDATLDIMETVQFGEVPSPDDSTTAVTTGSTTPSSGTRADISTAIDGTTYVSPNYGFSVDIPLEWTVAEEDPTVGDERIVLNNGTSIVTLWGTDADVGDLKGCIDYAAAQSGLDLEIDTNADGDEFRGVYGKQSFGNFVYDDGGTKMMYFIGCEPIPGTDSHLIVIQDVPYDQFTTQRRYRSQLENSIIFP